VLLDRIDRQQRRLQFALVQEPKSAGPKSPGVLRKGKVAEPAELAGGEGQRTSPERSGKRRVKAGKTKSKARSRDKKAKGKRK
jgi:ribonuclease R